MNERVTDVRISPSTSDSGISQKLQALGLNVRIDSAHEFVELDPPHSDGIQSPRQNPLASNPSGASRADDRADGPTPALKTEAVGAARLDTRFLNEVSQLAQQLHMQIQTEKEALDTRERALEDQRKIFDAEKQQFIHEIAHELAQIGDLKADLKSTEATLSERQIELDFRMSQFESEKEKLQLQFEEIEQQKQLVRAEILAEFQLERSEFDRIKANLLEEQDRVQLLKDWLQKRLDELTAENESTLKSEREKLWQSLTTEWEQRQAAFLLEQEEWTKTRDGEKSEIEREKALFESTVQSANEEFVAAREAIAAELSQLRSQQAEQLQTERDDWVQVREREQAEMQARRQTFDNELAASREECDALIRNERQEWEQTRQSEEAKLQSARNSLETELMELREQHAAVLRSEQKNWELLRDREKAEISVQQTEFLREQTLIENRIRFQQDHLEKSRFEFEQAQDAYRHERQVERQRIEETSMMMIRRLRQIDLYRTSIDEREKSLEREQELFQRTQKALSNTVELERINFQAEQQAWEQERQIQQADMRRQKEAMALLGESLENRRVRLDKLRAELEETHRATLEMRLAVEETWAQLTQITSQDEARQRVESVRGLLIEYYQKMHYSLEEQRRDQSDALSKFERQRAEFADERLKLTNWIASRDEELQSGEARLRAAALEAASNHSQWLVARDRWLLEKTEAEKLIRRLLASLGETNRDQSREIDTIFGSNQAGESAA